MPDAQRFQKRPFLRASRRSEDLRTKALRHLHRRQPNTTRGGVDQHLLSGMQMAHGVERIVRGHEGSRKRRSFLKTESSRFGRDEARLAYNMRTETAGANSHYCIARLEGAHTLADAHHDAGAFHPKGGIWEQAGGLEDIREVEGGGAHLDLDFIGTRRAALQRLKLQTVEVADTANLQAH